MSGIRGTADSWGRRALRRRIIAGLGAATGVVVLASPASAAQPNHQACLGQDISAYAGAGAAFGAFVSGALAPDGVGTEIQAHLAGDIPDAVIPNSCSD